MTDCERLRPQAAGIAAMPEGDPERVEWLAHARGCPDCMRALREAEAVLQLLDEAAPPAPAPSALARASRQIRSELAWLSRQPAVRAGAVLLGWLCLVFLAQGRARDGWMVSLSLAAAAAILAAFVRDLPAAGAALSASAIYILAQGRPGLGRGSGLDCFLVEQVCAAFPLAAVFWLERKTGSPKPQALASAIVSGALGGEAALHLTCPARESSVHLWLFHFGGVLFAVAVALIWSRRSAARAR